MNGTHVGQAVTKLSDDFLRVTSQYATINGTFLEGGAIFERNDKWHLLREAVLLTCHPNPTICPWLGSIMTSAFFGVGT